MLIRSLRNSLLCFFLISPTANEFFDVRQHVYDQKSKKVTGYVIAGNRLALPLQAHIACPIEGHEIYECRPVDTNDQRHDYKRQNFEEAVHMCLENGNLSVVQRKLYVHVRDDFMKNQYGKHD